ncbi:glutamate--tRNA ligase [Rickettsia conorii subsp. heilongjiangensis]|uniref:Glutamate--tRNA ligase n=1 Tax=Rickettsia conorii subsp. heilongjiangensis TaxID=226665 RepID=A0AAD1GI16_RICCR|nr:glutamate--tRNA ligase [Rickettsia conorii]AEK74490.1 glutamyl-tRNA synthetase [Rickettsia conorii subsp. heilongjiangensis 054]BBM91266.1 glutamate--tRNA ligase [Rickettsia conorii subsp. heilongjiangensis]BBM92475.1 glutamate--tRNA ligase [Rickettsia conorii subsp. heilongjiangensis]BBM93684.1 glutamate--tRNA ligase [Rickettsia conorii subsp. heilongjiangensis]BBM94893.1 glutamate--tRNA ligase [Rickettsia conorii subsp. heilongjiangensis]
MTKVITRFAPSPTGMLHVGNIRTALLNWLYAKKHNGQFILRFDDTDLERSKQEYKDAIEEDLKFLNINWDQTFNQLSRLSRYDAIKNLLLDKKRLYACYETPEELELKRKFQLSKGLPPIYDRASLNLTEEQAKKYIEQGRKPHYRFLVNHEPISWHDMIKGEVKYDGKALSDPIVIRADGSMTYMLCSVIDDIDYDITHIIRGEDHVSNTAIQMQMFEALNTTPPTFGHLSLIINKDEKISKRVGGFEIATLRKEVGIEAMAIASFFSLLGSSAQILPYKSMEKLANQFEISSFSKSPTIYQPEDLERLNHKLLISLDFDTVKERLKEIDAEYIDENFWLSVSPNLQKLRDVKDWWKICHQTPNVENLNLDKEYLKQAAELLPKGEITKDSWSIWTKEITNITGRKGKELFLPLRLALTARESGPEIAGVLPLIDREEIIKRLTSA